ncbi:MAG TPA: DUF4197 domain-containing protein [Nitrospirota bacterium]
MKAALSVPLLVLVVLTSVGNAFDLNKALKDAEEKILNQDKGQDEATKASGLKEALSIGTHNAVQYVSRTDGYFGNPAIKIPVPDEIKSVADTLSRVGLRKQVDEFVLSMNRGAEKAAPKAASIFLRAIKGMTIADATTILLGNDTAATGYFKAKTRSDLYREFKPVIVASLNEVGATKAFKEMMRRADSIPFLDKEAIDLDHYVTDKALEGLFYMVGQEEKKIRTDPAARVTDLLRTVFGGN